MFTFPIAFFSSSGSTPPAEAFENYYSTDFDGSNDYVTAPTSALNSLADCTISFWFKLDATSDKMMVGDYINGSNGIWLYWDGSSTWYFSPRNGSGVVSTTYSWTGKDTNWHHIVGVKSGTGGTIYIDGTSVATGTASATLTAATGNNFQIGALTGASLYANGKIDEVSVFDSALSGDDVVAIYNSGAPDSLASQSNLKGWWRMGDGANYPLIKNQAHFSQTALEFDGTNDYVDLGDVFDYGTFSISVWVKADAISTSKYEGIISKREAANSTKQFNLSLDNANKFYFWIFQSNGSYADVVSNSAIVIDTWYHVLAVADGSNLKMYVNGVLQSDTQSYDGTFQDTGSTTKIGEAYTHFWSGKIDDVAYYNNDQSSNVADIYNSGYPKDESERSGLVAYYKFDGDTYPVVRDETEFSNASLDFDGTDDYVDLNNGASVNPSSTVSLSCWVSFDALSNYDGIFGKRMGTSITMPFLLSLDNTSKIRFRIAQSDNTNKEIYTNSAVSTNTWYHVVAVADGTNIKLYLDGTLQTDTTTYDGTLKQSTADNVYIGRNANDYLNGKVSDAIIFSSALSASDVTSIYNSGKPKDESSLSNILGYWRMGDNTISPNVPSALGYGTHSVEFDGVDDYIDCGQVSALAGASAFTISGWFNQPTIDQARYMFGTRVSTTNQITCETWSNGFLYLEIRNGGSTYAYFDYSTVVSAGEWFHFAMVFDGSGATNADRMKAYVNGSEVTLTYIGTIPATTNATQGDFWIGNVYGQTQRWEGPIKQMGIFDSALSASDITSIYNSGLPKDISSESGLVSYWRMGDGEDKFPNILDYKGTNHGTMTNMASDDITTANVGSGTMTNMDSTDIVADSPAGTSGQMTNMDSGDFVAAKDAGTMVNMTAEDIVADVPS